MFYLFTLILAPAGIYSYEAESHLEKQGLLPYDKLESFTEKWLTEYKESGKTIFCQAGCSGCCNLAVHATLPEAARVAKKLPDQLHSRISAYITRLKECLTSAKDMKSYLRQHRTTIGPCPFLDLNGHCDIYALRPLSCRALLSTRPADWCEVDFAELDYWDKQAFESSLDRKIVAWPTHYVAATQNFARMLEQQILDEMTQRKGFAISGNFVVMVWLEANHQLSQPTMSLERIQDVLTENQLSNPQIINFANNHNDEDKVQRG